MLNKTIPKIFSQFFNGNPKINMPLKEIHPRIIKKSIKLMFRQIVSLLLLIDFGIRFFIKIVLSLNFHHLFCFFYFSLIFFNFLLHFNNIFFLS